VIGPHGEARTPDLVVLGPDENMTPDRIAWVADRARARGLPHHQTLMTSKPGSGINHKEFGVTSEGIFRWISLVLPVVGIAEGQTYTVKLTGGPDGDVGGNLLRILNREHGERCRVVAIADGTGYATDPAGLDWQELLRLVRESLGIAQFAPSRLSRDGKVVAVGDKLSELARNTLHNTVAADLFLPCGGRPYAINDQNWRDFLHQGSPSARAMVEGANIFLTPAARRGLEEAGLVVIKDSSANKGGVICSSYEVLAGLVLSEEEFLARKVQYVREVIGILCGRADAEGRALMAAWKRRGKNAKLSELSQQISEEINRVSGLIEPVIERHLEDEAFVPAWLRQLEAHCPPILVRDFGGRLATRIPRAHRVAILSKRLASGMVYREGLTWCRTYLQDSDRLWEVLSTYLQAETEVRAVADTIRRLGLPNAEELVRIISAGSQRELVRQRLGQEF
jgi:glutamate dehydrogenase